MLLDDDVDDGGADQASSFKLLHDKALPAAAKILGWNPARDLLAIATEDEQLLLYRVPWQRVWSHKVEVTALTWRPDGSVLAVGTASGDVHLRGVEDGEVIRSSPPHPSPARCLHWAQQELPPGEGGGPGSADRTPRFFPPPPKPPPAPGAALSSAFDMGSTAPGGAGGPLAEAREGRLSVLCIGHASGVIRLLACGLYSIAEIDVSAVDYRGVPQTFPEPLSLQQPSVLKVAMSSDLQHLVAVCSASGPAAEGTPGGAAALYQIGFDLSVLADRCPEIRQVALHAASIEQLLAEVAAPSVAAMERHWREAAAALEEKVRALARVLDEHGAQVSPKDALLAMQACGASDAVCHWLASAVGEPGLKRLAKGLDAAARQLHLISLHHLQPALEEVIFRLGELQGLARWRARSAALGLDGALLHAASEAAGMAFVQSERLLRHAAQESNQYRTFFVWLTKVLRQAQDGTRQSHDLLPPVDRSVVTAFLEQQFEQDGRIAPQLGPTPEGFELDISPEEEQASEEIALFGGFQDTSFLKRTLYRHTQSAISCCAAALRRPQEALSPALRATSVTRLSADGPAGLAALSVSFYRKPAPSGGHQGGGSWAALVALLQSRGGDEILLLRTTPGGVPGQEHRREALVLRAEGMAVVDVALYRDEQLAILGVERAPGGAVPRLLLVDVEGSAFAPAADELPAGVLQGCLDNGAVLEVRPSAAARSAALVHADLCPPLATGVSRGLCCALTARRRALVYDLEAQEEADD